jgi:hypothetical protein
MKANKSLTMAIASKGFDFTRKSYDEWLDYCKLKLKKEKAYKLNMASIAAV